ncbi:MAG: hypothetical protein E7222_00795 [Clostridiales bacterium]|uniref:YdbC family protein n=1 Tax=Aminipila sp. TaxID=2060095 RepID=UPI001DD434C0|nr:PC4/YdbC family ssDNA-binding protein [Aminipila sp.]MBE6033215.1 hypothetical protein [Clostridiales bacterium]
MSGNERKNEEITYQITEHIGVIAQYANRWTKELNKIAWNGSNPKFDIRDWDEQHEHMSRGITLHVEEMRIMYEILKDYFAEPLLEDKAV